jgi:hypothetical protein
VLLFDYNQKKKKNRTVTITVNGRNGLKNQVSQAWWLTPVILATQEAEIRRLLIQVTPGKKFTRPPSQPIGAWWQMSVILSYTRKNK